MIDFWSSGTKILEDNRTKYLQHLLHHYICDKGQKFSEANCLPERNYYSRVLNKLTGRLLENEKKKIPPKRTYLELYDY